MPKPRHLLSGLIATLVSWIPPAAAQIRLVENRAAPGDVALGETYIQDFQAPVGPSTDWTDNATFPGWLANFTRGQVSTGAMVARPATGLGLVHRGGAGAPATLGLLLDSTGDRALGGTPSGYAPGKEGIFSSESVNLVLRLRNDTPGVLTALRVGYDTVASSATNRDAVAFAYQVFPAGAGTLERDFIETHRYLNTYNGTFNDSMRTEFGRRLDRSSGWTAVVKDVAPRGADPRDRHEFLLRDIAVEPGAELWLAWHIAKEDEQGPDDPVTTTGIDNVRLADFTVGRPGLPVIVAHPRQLEVATGGFRSFTLSVTAAGPGLRYQWRKDGADIPGATSETYAATKVNNRFEGTYDVVVSNERGSVTSLPAKVNIYARREITVTNDVEFDAYSSGVKGIAASKTLGTRCDIYQPAKLERPAPAVLVIHGGGGNNGDKADAREVEAARELAARGWFVVSINYGMSSNHARCWPLNLWDAKQAVRWLRQKADEGVYLVDKDRIGAVGFSWGCNLASMLAMTGPEDDRGVADELFRLQPPPRGDAYDAQSTRIRCAAVFYGANDIPNYHRMKQFHRANAWTDRDLYRRASPVNYPNPTAAPMLFVHGSADDDVWQSQTETTYLLQRSVGARVEPYLQVPGGQHSFRLFDDKKLEKGFPSPIDVRPETIGFLARYLVGDTLPPAVLADPVSQRAAPGEPVSFAVAATAAPDPSFQWRKDGVALPGATSRRLDIRAGADTFGYYDVVVSNREGSVASGAALLGPR
jgi:acetyl esterase/lipase